MKRLVILLFLTGCASGPPLTEDEKEYNRQADWENWILCEQIYERAGQPTWHRDHSHHGRTRHWMVKQDLGDNQCRKILKDYWIHGV
jgi:hypothetical protein